jgi:hypothetical protein
VITVGDVTRVVDAPIGRIWALTGSWGPEPFYFPGILKCSVKGSGVGAVRTVTLKDYEAREILEVLDPETYTTQYRILEDGYNFPFTDAVGCVSLSSIDNFLAIRFLNQYNVRFVKQTSRSILVDTQVIFLSIDPKQVLQQNQYAGLRTHMHMQSTSTTKMDYTMAMSK